MLNVRRNTYWPGTHTMPFPRARVLRFAQQISKQPGQTVRATITLSYNGPSAPLLLQVYYNLPGSSGAANGAAQWTPQAGASTGQVVIDATVPSAPGLYDVRVILSTAAGVLLDDKTFNGELNVVAPPAPTSTTPTSTGTSTPTAPATTTAPTPTSTAPTTSATPTNPYPVGSQVQVFLPNTGTVVTWTVLSSSWNGSSWDVNLFSQQYGGYATTLS